MAIAKPTVDEVRAIITTRLADEQVQMYIDDAALMVQGCVALLDEDTQRAIVKWWTAHLIASAGRAAGGGGGSGAMVSRKLGDASTTWARGSLGAGAASTYYGQQAMMLDPSGCIAGLGRETARVWSVGGL